VGATIGLKGELTYDGWQATSIVKVLHKVLARWEEVEKTRHLPPQSVPII